MAIVDDLDINVSIKSVGISDEIARDVWMRLHDRVGESGLMSGSGDDTLSVSERALYEALTKCLTARSQIAFLVEGSEEVEAGNKPPAASMMKDEYQWITLAELAGWTKLEWWSSHGRNVLSGCHAIHANGEVPDYLNDLNAVHEIEKHLAIEDTGQYMRCLAIVTNARLGDFAPSSFNTQLQIAVLVHATAPQRCEAILKALGLWKCTKGDA